MNTLKYWLITILILFLAVILWWNSGNRTYYGYYGAICSDHPYGIAWRVGHLPELMIEGECANPEINVPEPDFAY